MTTKTASWLDVMPAIPLYGYYGPLRAPDAPELRVIGVGHDIAPSSVRVIGMSPVHAEKEIANGWLANTELRPDIDDPQGVAYVLRWLRMNVGRGALVTGMTGRWIHGTITEADKLDVARACAHAMAAPRSPRPWAP